jgi:hypothetical protein
MPDVKQDTVTVDSVMAWIRKTGSAKVRSGMARYGLPTENAVATLVEPIQSLVNARSRRDSR